GDVLENRLGERIRFLKHHPYLAAHGDHVDAGSVNVEPVHADAPFDACAGNDVVHPVQRANEGALAAPGWTDERGHHVRADLNGDVLQRTLLAVEERQVLDIDLERLEVCGGRGNVDARF